MSDEPKPGPRRPPQRALPRRRPHQPRRPMRRVQSRPDRRPLPFRILPARRRPWHRPEAPPPSRPRPRETGGRRDSRSGRPLAAPHAPRLDGCRLGRVHRGVGRGARRHRPLHVPQRPQRAAAAVQGRIPERVRGRRGRAVEREVRRLDRPDERGHRAEGGRVLRAARHLHTPRLHAELPVGRGEVQVSLPRQRIPHHGHQLRGRRRARSSARASCWRTTARSSSTSRASFSRSSVSGRTPRRFSRREACDQYASDSRSRPIA